MVKQLGCSKCRYGRRGCSRCNPNFIPLRRPSRCPKRAPCTISVVPFARTNAAGRIVAQKGIHWALTSRSRIDALTAVDVFFGMDWRTPPYDETKGVVLRLTLARSACMMHVPDTLVTIGEVLSALKIATKATLGDTLDVPNVPNILDAPRLLKNLENLENPENPEDLKNPENPDNAKRAEDPDDMEDFELDSLDMDRYDRVAFNSSVLPNHMPLSTYVKTEVYKINRPMILHVLLRP
jgi:hypothetical protein